jgi:sn-glycerol 3-phosphate transport system ATP-binding protein
MATIAIDNVAKAFGNVQVLHDIELAIADGEFLVLVGPSGCGKSTLLRIIAGLEHVSGGAIAIDGRDVTDLPAKARDIAMVFQSYALYPHMTVAENMAFSLRVRRADKKLIEERVQAAAKILNLTEYLKRRPAELSGGQRQRVAMGRAIVREPQAFLFDEPLSNLDAKLRVQMRAEIRKLHNRLKATSIFVTHDQVEAMTLADLVVVMNGGRIEQIGAPTEVYRLPATRFVATFIGSPAMNLMPGKVVGPGVVETGGGRIGYVADAFEASDGSAVELGIRPEDLRFGTGGEGEMAFARDFVEELGATRLIHGTVGSAPIALAVAATAGDTGTSLAADCEAVHLFDPDSGNSLRRP